MNFKKRLPALVLSVAMVASLATGAFAAKGTNDNTAGTAPGAGEIAANGHTTISIMEATVDPSNISFEVPLYVTMAVISNEATAVVPNPNIYEIKNTTSADNGSFPIGVTRMSFEKLAAGGWNTVATVAEATGASNIHMTINKANVPAISTAKSEWLNLVGTGFMASTTAFTPIAPNASMKLPIVATVASMTRTNTGAAAQFKVKYTISALDANGLPLGAAYVGDDRVLAGLAPYVANP